MRTGIFIFVFCFSYLAGEASASVVAVSNSGQRSPSKTFSTIVSNSGQRSPSKESSVVVSKLSGQRSPSKTFSTIVSKSGQSLPSKESVQFYLSKKDPHNIKMILDLPLENRKQALLNYGSLSFPVLKYLVFSKTEKMPVRWKALTGLARVYPERSLPYVRKALRDPVWFLRNAGLIAIEIINPQESLRWAGEFLNDPSLIVRTAAVGMIKKHEASQYKIRLLEKLNAPDSFYKHKSLWIRHHIVSALADFSESGEERMFITFLQDPDKRLHPYAISALEKLTGKTFRFAGDKQEVAKKTQRLKWIHWWSEGHYKSSSTLPRKNLVRLINK